jgi:hypothetical protein
VGVLFRPTDVLLEFLIVLIQFIRIHDGPFA